MALRERTEDAAAGFRESEQRPVDIVELTIQAGTKHS
ncbi:hypothetical protein DSC45_12355 [Streptomyces sp. YIM 130001]|nr:hypothetical protein DSC45_12355 [Streptomyces sp. YIM 130001]